MTTSWSGSDSEFITEVRDALAGLDTTKIPDDTITQSRDRIASPALNDMTGSDPDQDYFDNALIMWTAELSFQAWLTFTRLRDREIEVFTNPDGYKKDLKTRTNQAFRVLGVTRPSEIPNTVVTVKHDDEERRVNLNPAYISD